MKDMGLKDKRKICILFNKPEERDLPDRKGVMDEVNLVGKTLSNLGYSYFLLPVGGDYKWIDILKKRDFDLVFNLCEDFEGNPEGEAYIAGILETLKIPYTGSPPSAFYLCFDKIKAKIIVSHYGIETPPYFTLDKESPDFLPVILKPRKEDASLFIEKKNVIFNEREYYERVKELRGKNIEFFAEKFIDGREFNVSVFDERVIAIGEVIFKTEPKVLTYSSKWDVDSEDYIRTSSNYPAILDDKKRKEIEEISLKIFKILEMRDYGRIDFRMDKDGKVYFIEANPNPDISRNSGFYRALLYARIPYELFIKHLIERTIERNIPCFALGNKNA